MYKEANSQRARWAVFWIASNGKRSKVVRKDFGDDLYSAEVLYHKARDAGKRAATLACVNMGFPPPVHLRDRQVTKRGRSRRTGKIKTVTVTVSPLKELNIEGKLWCPYCRKIRPFRLAKFFVLNGIKVSDPRYVCPICEVSQKDHNVRTWNPHAVIHMDSSLATRTRRSSRTTTTRRRRRASA